MPAPALRRKIKNVTTSNAVVAQAAYDLYVTMLASHTEDLHLFVSCSKTKQSLSDRAENLYSSPLFRKSMSIAKEYGVAYHVLSAKYGLLSPDTLVDDYDFTLQGQPPEFVQRWAKEIARGIEASVGGQKKLIFLAGQDYVDPIMQCSPELASRIEQPMQGLSLGNRLSFLNHCLKFQQRRKEIAKFYDLLSLVKEKQGINTLYEKLKEKISMRGIYFFFDGNEKSTFSTDLPRLVRIGTHGVSVGSKSTLRARLRTHLGAADGSGNHRASVFRLHVGRALITREGSADHFPEWGKGSVADALVRARERTLECRVSNYIKDLLVLYIPIDDPPGTNSLRALFETSWIALFSEGLRPLEPASRSWLGHFSDKESIRESGLWNVRDVGRSYDLQFSKFATQYVEQIFA